MPLIRNENGISILQVLIVSTVVCSFAFFISAFAFVSAKREETLRKQTVQGEISRTVRFYALNSRALDDSATVVSVGNAMLATCLQDTGVPDCVQGTYDVSLHARGAPPLVMSGNTTAGLAADDALYDVEGRRCDATVVTPTRDCFFAAVNTRMEVNCGATTPCNRFGIIRFTWQVIQAFTDTTDPDGNFVFLTIPPYSDFVDLAYVNYKYTVSIDLDQPFLLASLPLIGDLF